MDETTRRRVLQQEYNRAHNIVPQSIIKPIDMSLVAVAEGDYVTVPLDPAEESVDMTPEQRSKYIAELEERMRESARKFEFEKAIELRERIKKLRLEAAELRDA
jgi:excinuclease ABC subunit B